MISDWIAPNFETDPVPVLVLLAGVASLILSLLTYLSGDTRTAAALLAGSRPSSTNAPKPTGMQPRTANTGNLYIGTVDVGAYRRRSDEATITPAQR